MSDIETKKELNSIEQLLEVKGVNAQGYGIIPKIAMRDSRLPIESKAIYSYLCSFAGAGITAFPSIEIMQKELNIGENAFFKYRKFLMQFGYITVTKKRNGNRWAKIIYELCPNPIQEKVEHRQIEGVQIEGVQIGGVQIGGVQNDGTIINSKVSYRKDNNNARACERERIELNEYIKPFIEWMELKDKTDDEIEIFETFKKILFSANTYQEIQAAFKLECEDYINIYNNFQIAFADIIYPEAYIWQAVLNTEKFLDTTSENSNITRKDKRAFIRGRDPKQERDDLILMIKKIKENT